MWDGSEESVLPSSVVPAAQVVRVAEHAKE